MIAHRRLKRYRLSCVSARLHYASFRNRFKKKSEIESEIRETPTIHILGKQHNLTSSKLEHLGEAN